MKDVVFISILLLTLSSAFELNHQSGDTFVGQGDLIALECISNEPWDFCTWTHVEAGLACSVSKEDVAAGVETCMGSDRVKWDVDSTGKCGVIIEEASRETDLGNYTCALVKLEDDNSGALTANGGMKVNVALPSQVEFKGIFAIDDVIAIPAGEGKLVECHALGGFPEPRLQASLGNSPDVIDLDNDKILPLAEGASTREAYTDGTVDISQSFVLVASAYETEMFVKCEAIQEDENGDILFESGSNVVSRQIEVTFPPQPLQQELEPFEFIAGETTLQVDITFLANPVPENNQARWHVNTGSEASELDVQAGDTLGSKYSALDLQTWEGAPNVTASFVIYDLIEDDQNVFYYLEVITAQGEERYDFSLRAAPNDTSNTNNNGGDGGGNDQVQESGLSGGAIAGIIICCVLALALIGFGVWAFMTNRFCFDNDDKDKKAKKSKHSKQQKPPQRSPSQQEAEEGHAMMTSANPDVDGRTEADRNSRS